MSVKKIALAAVTAVSLVMATAVWAAGDKPLVVMAKITKNLNHFPSDSEKAELKKIIDSDKATPAEKIIATALINLNHSPQPEDLKKLETVQSTDPAFKLAEIVKKLNHKPSAEDKKTLDSIK